MRSLLWILASPLLALASQITLQSARVVVLSEDGGPTRSELCVALRLFAFSTLTLHYSSHLYYDRLSLETNLEPHVTLGSSETLRISFTVLDKNSGKGVVPHQTFLRMYDPATHEEGVHPIKVNTGGKGKIDIVCALLSYATIFSLFWTYNNVYAEHEKASRMATPNNGCAHPSPAHHWVL
jgi:oligosaccharyltransferase complex subunit delta (ribophorin II)